MPFPLQLAAGKRHKFVSVPVVVTPCSNVSAIRIFFDAFSSKIGHLC